jgi:hypothetical protein
MGTVHMVHVIYKKIYIQNNKTINDFPNDQWNILESVLCISIVINADQDPDPSYLSECGPDPGSQTNADPDPGQTLM